MIEIGSLQIKKAALETLAVAVCEDKDLNQGPVAALVEAAREVETVKGESGEMIVVHRPAGFRLQRAIFAGLGKAGAIDAEALRKWSGRAVKYAMERHLAAIDIAVPDPAALALDPAVAIKALAEGAGLANQVFDLYKQEQKLRPLERIRLLTTAKLAKAHAPLMEQVTTICAGSAMARTWVSIPSNDKVPQAFARTVADAGRQAGLKVTVLDEKDLAQHGFGALLAVAAGSRNRPALVILEHRPEKTQKNHRPGGKRGHLRLGGDQSQALGFLHRRDEDGYGRRGGRGRHPDHGRAPPQCGEHHRGLAAGGKHAFRHGHPTGRHRQKPTPASP